jgi:hypothetical protein
MSEGCDDDSQSSASDNSDDVSISPDHTMADLAMTFGKMALAAQEGTPANLDITNYLVGMLEIAMNHRKVRMRGKPGPILTAVERFDTFLKAALDVRPPGRGVTILRLFSDNLELFDGLGSTIRACTARGIDRNQALGDRWYIVNACEALKAALAVQATTFEVAIIKKTVAAASRTVDAFTTSEEEIATLLTIFDAISKSVTNTFARNSVDDVPDSASRASTPASDGGRDRTLSISGLTPSVSPAFPTGVSSGGVPGDS